VPFYQPRWCHSLEHHNPDTHGHENLKPINATDIQAGHDRNYFSNINVPPNLELVLGNFGVTVVTNNLPKSV
jgi:hypothetical protein